MIAAQAAPQITKITIGEFFKELAFGELALDYSYNERLKLMYTCAQAPPHITKLTTFIEEKMFSLFNIYGNGLDVFYVYCIIV